MPIAPNGLPDVDSFGDYGGPLQNKGQVDGFSETAEQRNIYAANVAAMTHTIARSLRSFIGDGTAGSARPTGLIHEAVWTSVSTGAAVPVVTAVAAGTFDLFYPTLVSDALGNRRPLALKRAGAAVESSNGTFYYATAKVVGNRKVRVYTYDSTLALANVTGQVVTVWVR